MGEVGKMEKSFSVDMTGCKSHFDMLDRAKDSMQPWLDKQKADPNVHYPSLQIFIDTDFSVSQIAKVRAVFDVAIS